MFDSHGFSLARFAVAHAPEKVEQEENLEGHQDHHADRGQLAQVLQPGPLCSENSA